MKFLIGLLVLVSTNAFALEFVQRHELQVPAALVENLTRAVSLDNVVEVRALSVYRGGAAGMSSVVLTILTEGEGDGEGGDYRMTATYEGEYVSNDPTNMKLTKVGTRTYNLEFDVTEISMDGDFVYTDRHVILKIAVMMNGTVEVTPEEAPVVASETFTLKSVVRCLCNASMLVESSSGKKGYVLDTQKVDSVTLSVNGQSVTLQNPPNDVRDYYAGSQRIEWVVSELAKQGITAEGEISLISFTGAVPLYTDYNGTTQI